MKKIVIDLFSDTNCDPSPAMRQAMCQAEVGNEVAGEDPTVNRLLEAVCDLLGKECGLFMPSGTMCNGVAYRVWCNRAGDRIFFDQQAHAANMAAGLPGGLVQATAVGIPCQQGIFNGEQLESSIGSRQGYNIPRARVVSIEQTTNLGGGAIWPLSTLQAVHQVARQHAMMVHMDGARLFNAVIASGIAAHQFCQYADSVWIDFAKGLGAPMGAVLCGDKAFIEEAWYYKFQQGGAMHQVGILAAGCLYALEHHVSRLAQDHEHALLLAQSLATHPNIAIDVKAVVTNIVIFQLQTTRLTAEQLVQQLLDQGIRLLALANNRLRAIVHQGISRNDICSVSDAIQSILTQSARTVVG
ncbi:MAG: GntG family PLP-dependent aldolase [Candidatus Symbiodolus clandestinus]